MKATGQCYCGELRFSVEFDPKEAVKGQCHCRPCQKISGGSPNVFLMAPERGFSYTTGAPKRFARSDLDAPVTREFCGACGTPILTRNPDFSDSVILKAGALDDQKVFGLPRIAIHVAERCGYHMIPEGVHEFQRLPG